MSCYYDTVGDECVLLLKYDPTIGWVTLVTSLNRCPRIVILSTLGWVELCHRLDFVKVSDA